MIDVDISFIYTPFYRLYIQFSKLTCIIQIKYCKYIVRANATLNLLTCAITNIEKYNKGSAFFIQISNARGCKCIKLRIRCKVYIVLLIINYINAKACMV